jgi:hypothetical protein
MFEGDEYDAMETRLKGFWPNFRSNLVADRKQIADAVVTTGGYQI